MGTVWGGGVDPVRSGCGTFTDNREKKQLFFPLPGSFLSPAVLHTETTADTKITINHWLSSTSAVTKESLHWDTRVFFSAE